MSFDEVMFLDAVEDVSRGNRKIPQSDFLASGKLAVVDQGQRLVAGYTDDSSTAVAAGGPVVVFGDHTRAVKYVDFPFAMGADGVKVLRAKDGFDTKFLYRYLESREIPSAGYSRHFKFLKDINVPKPSIDEQCRIAKILDHADAIRTNRRQILTHLDTLTQSIFHMMFGGRADDIKRLEALVDTGDRMNYGVVQPGDVVPDGVPLIRISDLVDGRVDRRNLKRISPDVESAYKRSRIRGNEILVNSVGYSIGDVAVASSDDEGSNIARAITRVPISDPVLRSYLAAYLRSPEPQRYFAAESRTVAQPTLNVKQLAATPVPIPPAALQRQFAERVEQINTQRAAAQKALAADNELFASLQSRAFKGEL
ncbi:MAG: restriction endonuclease subunit S [Pseudonocardiaceae bacterium]